MSSIEEKVKHMHIPLQELEDATGGFSDRNLLARGGFGKVYKGVSVKHGNIAIKMLDPRLGQGDHEFKTEIALLSVYKHENIVSLLGFCDEVGKKILVYKYESKGSLDKHLESVDLTWIQRLQICLDAARGLQYLHDDVEPHSRILHRDVKSSNILLDENLKAKISDFGLARIGPANMNSTFLISNACGTVGYIDPDYLIDGYLTQKSDVYSFGVVLFEVLCGRLARVVAYKDQRQILTNLVKIHWGRKQLDAIVHPHLQKEIKTASLLTFSTIAYQCLLSGNERPAMKKVVEQLQKALDNQLAPIDLWMDAAHHEGRSGLLPASYFQSNSASTSRSSKYDVFMSYKQEDTRTTFVEHLCMTLERQGISIFRDEIDMGRRMRQDTINDIQESGIAIIIFSKEYVAYTRNLEQLEVIMKNKGERGQIVIPIYFYVKPSEVRSQTGRYHILFSGHELDKGKLVSWKKALVEAASLPGWDVANGHEVKSIQTIVDHISHHLLSIRSKASAETNSDTELIGMVTRMQDLKSHLRVGSGGVHMVGVCGMWGSGKSTLASSIYDEISHEFEGCCFIKNVRTKLRMHGLKMLQEEILSNVLKTEVVLENVEQGTSMLETRLRQNSVLIVLDDVDHIDHLDMLIIAHDWFGNGSRIIYTTRNQDLGNARNVLTHNVRLLDDTEAIELFSTHAFGKSKPIQAGFEEISRNLVSKFGGHPSTIISFGSFLYGKEMSEWVSIFDRVVGIQVEETLKNLESPDDVTVRNTST